MSVSWILLLIVGMALALVVCIVVTAIVVLRRGKDLPKSVPPRPEEPMRVERVERISREIEKINEMLAAGRISDDEAAELKAALEGERRAWSDNAAEFAKQSGAACAGLAKKRLTKSNNAVLTGVCGGLAEWLGCDATLLRVVYVLLALFMAGFPGIILYLILWLVMPPPEPVMAADVPGNVQPTQLVAGKPGKGCLIFLLCLVIVPVLMALFFFIVRSGAVRKEGVARMESMNAAAHAKNEQMEENLLLNPSTGVTDAHRLYAATFRWGLGNMDSKLKGALKNSGIYQNTPGGDSILLLSESGFSGGFTYTFYFWSGFSENVLLEKLQGLKTLPARCSFESLRAVGAPSGPAMSAPVAR